MGAKWIQPDAASTDQAPASGDAHPFEHCPFCSLHANAVAIPVAPLAPVPASALPHPLPAAFLAAPRTLYAWLSAQSRAPPFLS